jgi:sigma-B regulation protein RsbU (phosphoserine phosphatase)
MITVFALCAGVVEMMNLRKRRRGSRPQSLTQIRKTLHGIFDAVPDGVILIDETGAIQFFNSGAEKLFGYRRDEIRGEKITILMPSLDQDVYDRSFLNYLQAGIKKITGVGREVNAQRKDGCVLPIFLSIGDTRLGERRMFVGIAQDLTSRIRAEQKVLTLSSAIDQSPNAVLIANKDGVIEYVNGSFVRLSGYDAKELMGQNPRMLQAGHADRDQYRRLWRAILEGREWRGEIEDRRKDGTRYWARQTITPLRDALGEITHYLAIQEDITALKLEQEALAESEERFRNIAEMTGEWLWEQNPEGRYTYSSVAVTKILGFSPEEIVGKCYLELQCSDDLSSVASNLSRPYLNLVNQYRHKNGHIVFTESSGMPLFGESGEILRWRGVDHDITERKAFEDALRLRNRAMESLHVGVAICDARVPGLPNIYVNPALCRITGYSTEELIGKNTRILRGPETDLATLERMTEALEHGQDYEATLRSYREGGAPFWNELSIAPVADESGDITHYVESHTDVTERRKADENRRQLEIAKHIQLSLLPRTTLRLAAAEVAGVCLPASHVGGDYFDFFENAKTIDVVIADVSGHNVGAALLMTELRSALHLETRLYGTSGPAPGNILHQLNEVLYDDLNKTESFITMFLTKYDSGTGLLHYANAGHNKALLLRASANRCLSLDANGLVLGAMRNVTFEEKSIQLFAGDLLALYTDGVIEARNAKQEFFGIDRLSSSLLAHRASPPEDLVTRILAEVRAFCADYPLDDDVAIVIMRVKGPCF